MIFKLIFSIFITTFCTDILAITHSNSTSDIRLATTTSLENTGLLVEVLPKFTAKTGIKVSAIAVGTGEAIELAKRGDVDFIWVHNKTAEQKFMRESYGLNRTSIMFNDFVILGPKTDPVKLESATNITQALQKIANSQFPFISRGDNSGTDMVEKKLWHEAKIIPQNNWYKEVGQGMASALFIASEQNAYILSDRATYLSLKPKLNLDISYAGDKSLLNTYSVIAVNPKKNINANYKDTLIFIKWISSAEGQKLIKNFKKNGVTLFHLCNQYSCL